jgi:hypothetical protein
MTTQLRIPYFSLQYPGFFVLSKTWQLHDAPGGCRPLDNPQARILMERRPPFLPGEKELIAKQAAEKRQADAAEAKQRKAAQKAAPQQSRSQASNVEKVALRAASDLPKSKPQAAACRPPPPFDMLDLPEAMDNMHFFVGSKLARRWFNSRRHEIPDNRDYIYPDDMVDTKIVTLDFILKYPRAQDRYEHLVRNGVYDGVAFDAIKEKMRQWLAAKFIDKGTAYSGDLDSLALCRGDIQKLNNEFQFRRETVSNFDTLSWRLLTDLTASLANFDFVAAIANARIYTTKYFSYPKGQPMVYCCESTVEVTHIYVYARDSYSFADRPGKKASQYLGHWNKGGVVLVPEAVTSELANKFADRDIQWGDVAHSEEGFGSPVDLLRGMFGQQMRKQDVHYPVHNSDYLAWRQKFNRGGDFLICTKPTRIKLRESIKITLDEICKPAKLAYGK